MPLDTKILSQAATEARGLAMDAVQAAASGHLGLPLGAAEVGAVLFGHALNYFPEDPALDQPRPIRPVRRTWEHVPLQLAAPRRI